MEEDGRTVLGSEEELQRCSSHLTDQAISSRRKSMPFMLVEQLNIGEETEESCHSQ